MSEAAHDEPVGPHCPACGQPPAILLDGGAQAFCDNDDCEVLSWNPTKTRKELEANTSKVRWPL